MYALTPRTVVKLALPVRIATRQKVRLAGVVALDDRRSAAAAHPRVRHAEYIRAAEY